jgi:hypothetical protein
VTGVCRVYRVISILRLFCWVKVIGRKGERSRGNLAFLAESVKARGLGSAEAAGVIQ